MSIYSTLWSIQIEDPAAPFTDPSWVKITAQAVPPHIGSPTPVCGYEDGDLYADFLPPALETDENMHAPWNRAVVFITNTTLKGTDRNPQEYVEPLLVLSGREYAAMSFDALHDRLQEAIRSGPRVIAEFKSPAGRHGVITTDDLDESDGDTS